MGRMTLMSSDQESTRRVLWSEVKLHENVFGVLCFNVV